MFQDLRLELVVLKFFALLVALTMSTAAKAILAVRLGDRSYALKQRATFNPIVHVDPFGTLLFPILLLLVFPSSGVIFGWAKPTFIRLPFSRRWRLNLVLLTFASPFFNFFIAFVSALLLNFMRMKNLSVGSLDDLLFPLFQALFSVNIALGFFHLLPFPRSDVWNLILAFLKPNQVNRLQNLSTYIWFGLMFLVFSGIFLRFIILLAALIDWCARLPLSLLFSI